MTGEGGAVADLALAGLPVALFRQRRDMLTERLVGTHPVGGSDAVTVAVTYNVPAGSLIRSSFVPSPGNVIRARAIFELPVD